MGCRPTDIHVAAAASIFYARAGKDVEPLKLFAGPAYPDRYCNDRRNFRCNGPEDARLLPLGDGRVLVMYADYDEGARRSRRGHPGPRRQFARVLTLGPASLTDPKALKAAPEYLGEIEKNWVTTPSAEACCSRGVDAARPRRCRFSTDRTNPECGSG